MDLCLICHDNCQFWCPIYGGPYRFEEAWTTCCALALTPKIRRSPPQCWKRLHTADWGNKPVSVDSYATINDYFHRFNRISPAVCNCRKVGEQICLWALRTVLECIFLVEQIGERNLSIKLATGFWKLNCSKLWNCRDICLPPCVLSIRPEELIRHMLKVPCLHWHILSNSEGENLQLDFSRQYK